MKTIEVVSTMVGVLVTVRLDSRRSVGPLSPKALRRWGSRIMGFRYRSALLGLGKLLRRIFLYLH